MRLFTHDTHGHVCILELRNVCPKIAFPNRNQWKNNILDCTVLHRLHFVLLYFLRSLDMPSKNKTANPSMYVVFSFVDNFALLSVVFFLVIWSCIFLYF